MPGLVGYVKNRELVNGTISLEAMAHRLQPESRFKRDLFEEDGIGLGRVSLGILNAHPQPVWNQDRSLGIILDGEFYNQDRIVQSLKSSKTPPPSTGRDAELALSLYQEMGEQFASCLNGAYTLAIWDRRERKLLITNDRLGLYPLYYANTSQGLIFASGVRALLADPSLSRLTDKIAFAQFLTFEHVLDDRTFLDSVKLLPQASLLRYVDGNLSVQPYWRLQYPELYEVREEEEYVGRLNDLLDQAVKSQTQDHLTKGLLLSGGLDSRMVLGPLVKSMPPRQLHTFTWGIPGCDDCRAAKELAQIVGATHHFYQLKPDWLVEKAAEAIRLTDGMGNVVNLHAIASAEEEGRIANVIFKGFLGDAMFGYAVNRRFWADYDVQSEYPVHKQSHRGHGVIIFDDSDYPSLFTDEVRKSIGDAVFESYRAGMKRSNARQLASQRLYFDYTQRVPRMTLNGVEVVRGYAAVRLPFADYDLVELSTMIPPGYMFERYIAYRAFIERYPDLAKVPNPSTGLPMISCLRDAYLRAQKDLRWHLQKAKLEWLIGPEFRPYKDYALWFRTDLKNWVEEILLDKRSMERGYFQPETIRQLVAEHMAGADHSVRLALLITLELWQRQFLD